MLQKDAISQQQQFIALITSRFDALHTPNFINMHDETDRQMNTDSQK